MIYGNAYDATGRLDPNRIITEQEFNRLQVSFAKDYLTSIHYEERLQMHRNPPTVIQETLNDIYPYLQEIQRRKETVDIDEEKRSFGNIVSKVGWIWQENKKLRSLYNAVLSYCKLRNKEPNIIATHIAEYKSLVRLARLLEVRVNKARKFKKEISITELDHHVPKTITDSDRIIRELDIIQYIFKAQIETANLEIPFVYPEVLDAEGKNRVDGLYWTRMDIFSEHELFPIQQYKQVFTSRYEATTNPELIRNQLAKIYEKAKNTRDWYNENLTGGKHVERMTMDFLATNDIADLEERQKALNAHSAVVTINDYKINIIYQGTDRHTIGGFLHRLNYRFNYLVNNYDLALICQHVMDFIELFSLPAIKTDKKKTKDLTNNYNQLQEVFISPEKYHSAINALQQIGGIDASLNNISGPQLKGMVQVWVSLLQKANSLKHIKDGELTVLLNMTFKGLNLGENTDGRTLRNVSNRATKNYKQKLNQLL